MRSGDHTAMRAVPIASVACVAACCTLAVLLPAHAQEERKGFYIGGSLGALNADDLDSGAINRALAGQGLAVRTTSVDTSDVGWKLFAGYRFNAYLAVEGGYTYLGEYAFAGQVIEDPGTASANLQADDWNAFAVGILPLGERFDVFAKLGIGYWTADLATSGTFSGAAPRSTDSSGTDPIAGLGARFNITGRWGIRAEWERFFNIGSATTSGETDIDFWSLGVQYRF
jgi:OOP family OmpA-OmpF porin